LGADGISSSCHGPEEAFRALGGHTHLGLYLALATEFHPQLLREFLQRRFHLRGMQMVVLPMNLSGGGRLAPA
jgi:hypothetical protein